MFFLVVCSQTHTRTHSCILKRSSFSACVFLNSPSTVLFYFRCVCMCVRACVCWLYGAKLIGFDFVLFFNFNISLLVSLFLSPLSVSDFLFWNLFSLSVLLCDFFCLMFYNDRELNRKPSSITHTNKVSKCIVGVNTFLKWVRRSTIHAHSIKCINIGNKKQ